MLKAEPYLSLRTLLDTTEIPYDQELRLLLSRVRRKRLTEAELSPGGMVQIGGYTFSRNELTDLYDESRFSPRNLEYHWRVQSTEALYSFLVDFSAPIFDYFGVPGYFKEEAFCEFLRPYLAFAYDKTAAIVLQNENVAELRHLLKVRQFAGGPLPPLEQGSALADVSRNMLKRAADFMQTMIASKSDTAAQVDLLAAKLVSLFNALPEELASRRLQLFKMLEELFHYFLNHHPGGMGCNRVLDQMGKIDLDEAQRKELEELRSLYLLEQSRLRFKSMSSPGHFADKRSNTAQRRGRAIIALVALVFFALLRMGMHDRSPRIGFSAPDFQPPSLSGFLHDSASIASQKILMSSLYENQHINFLKSQLKLEYLLKIKDSARVAIARNGAAVYDALVDPILAQSDSGLVEINNQTGYDGVFILMSEAGTIYSCRYIRSQKSFSVHFPGGSGLKMYVYFGKDWVPGHTVQLLSLQYQTLSGVFLHPASADEVLSGPYETGAIHVTGGKKDLLGHFNFSGTDSIRCSIYGGN